MKNITNTIQGGGGRKTHSFLLAAIVALAGLPPAGLFADVAVNLVRNGDFESSSPGSANSGSWAYCGSSGFSNPEWTITESKCGLSKANGTWVASGIAIGTYAMYIQSLSTADRPYAYQDIEVSAPGSYVVEFDYVSRPSHAGQEIWVYFGEITEEKTDLGDDDLVDSFTAVNAGDLTHRVKLVTVPSAGTYRLKFVGTSSSDKATAFDNITMGKPYLWQTDTLDGDLYHRHAHAVAGNILFGATCEEIDMNRGGTSGAYFTNPNSRLTDGDAVYKWVDYNDSLYLPKVYAIKSGTLAWTFPATNISEIAVFSRWGNGGRDGIRIGSVYVMLEGSEEWTKLDAAKFANGVGDNSSSSGALCAILNRIDGAPIAANAIGLKIEFPTGQDNDYAGYAEVAAYSAVPREYVWTGAAENRLVSDAGNWADSKTGAAVGAAGDAFAPTFGDSLEFPASAEAIVDVPLNIFALNLDSGVTLSNPSGGAVTNTISLGKVFNAGESAATVCCKTEFTDGYTVNLAAPVVFAGGATASGLGYMSGDAGFTFSGDIALSGAMELAIDRQYVIAAGSRFSATVLRKRDAVNMQSVVLIEEGAYAHFGTITGGRDRLHPSIHGVLEVDDYYTTVCCIRNNIEYRGDFGYNEDGNYNGGTLIAGGLQRGDFSTDKNYPDFYSYIYPANVYIGANGISQTTGDRGIGTTGCAKHIYAMADFSIRGPNASSGTFAVNADTTIDTRGHNVTWTSALSGASLLTKAGEGALVMAAYSSSGFTGGISVTGGDFVVLKPVAMGGAFSLAGESSLVYSNLVAFVDTVVAQSFAVSGNDAGVKIEGNVLADGSYTLVSVTEGVIPEAALALTVSGSALPSGKNAVLALSEDSKSLMLHIYGDGACTWTGRGADGNLSTPENWLNGAVPNQGGETVFIPDAVKTLVNDLPAFSPASITFTGADAVTISGNPITGLLAVTNLSPSAHHEFTAPVTFQENAEADILAASTNDKYIKWTGGMTAYTLKKSGAPGSTGDIRLAGLVTITKNISNWGGYAEIDHLWLKESGSVLTIPNPVVQSSSPANFSVDAGAKVFIDGDLTVNSNGDAFAYEIKGTVEASGWIVKAKGADVRFASVNCSGYLKAYGLKETAAGSDSNGIVLTTSDSTSYQPKWVIGAGGVPSGTKLVTHDADASGEIKIHFYAADDFAIDGKLRLGYKTNSGKSRWVMLHVHPQDVDGTNPRTITMNASFFGANLHPCIRVYGEGTFKVTKSFSLPNGVEVHGDKSTLAIKPGVTVGGPITVCDGSASGTVYVYEPGTATFSGSVNFRTGTTLKFYIGGVGNNATLKINNTLALGDQVNVELYCPENAVTRSIEPYVLMENTSLTTGHVSKFNLVDPPAWVDRLAVDSGKLLLYSKVPGLSISIR